MYKDMNDYEILYMVNDTKENNFDLLVHKYQPLIYKIVKEYLNTFKRFGYELDDLMQIGYITLYKASYLYDIYSHSMFYTYFRSSLKKAIFNLIRYNSTNKKETLNNALSYESTIPNTNMHYIDLFADKETDNKLDLELITFKNSMSINLSWIFQLFYNGYNKDEISILLDENIDTVKDNFNKIKEHALTYKYLFFE